MVKETWVNFRTINKMKSGGMSFSEIAAQFDDSEEHIADFWNRFLIQKRENWRRWDKEHKEENKVKTQAYRDKNRDRIRARERRYAAEHSEHIKQKRQENYEQHREERLEYFVQYYEQNRETLLQRNKEYRDNKKQEQLDKIKQESSFADGNAYRSSYENMVADYLYDSGIQYCHDKTYDDLFGRNNGKLKYDFYIIDYGIIIETDGEQHFYPVRFNGIDIELAQQLFEETQYHDQIKNEYCAEHGIPILRIPYYNFRTDEWKEMIDNFISEHNVIKSA